MEVQEISSYRFLQEVKVVQIFIKSRSSNNLFVLQINEFLLWFGTSVSVSVLFSLCVCVCVSCFLFTKFWERPPSGNRLYYNFNLKFKRIIPPSISVSIHFFLLPFIFKLFEVQFKYKEVLIQVRVWSVKLFLLLPSFCFTFLTQDTGV